MNNESNNIKIICPEDCGNAPKKQFLKEFNIAFAKNDLSFVSDNITDDFRWNKIGKEQIQGKESVIEVLKQLQNSKVTELHINKIITHGYDGSVNGAIQLENKQTYSFCHVFTFASSRNNSKIKECLSYIIELPESN
ncbi:nuclear transport factor 2-like protein [Bacillus ndiopicus]|uniref:hypothetical protein n=1 Tax=Bacillus ndiopicus TaxID=1347368 RepID=UPI0005A9B362|nr:hypothetical protein [Bacillus ndiopicus]